MKNQPLVSIVTVNYKQPAVTCELLDSILKNSYKNLEVIVVDNECKEDCTYTFKKHYPSVKVLNSTENLGFAGGNNLGIKASKGDFVFLVNNDTVWTEGLVEALLSRFAENVRTGVVSPKICYFQTPQYIQYAGFTEMNNLTGRNETIGKNQKDDGQFNQARATPYAHGAAMMLKREVIEKVGLMPEDFFLYYEELDWCAHIQRAGFDIWYEPKGLIYHKESASVGKLSPLKMYYMTRNRILFMRRNTKPLQLAGFLTYFFTVTMPTKTVSFLLKGELSLLKTFWRGAFGFRYT